MCVFPKRGGQSIKITFAEFETTFKKIILHYVKVKVERNMSAVGCPPNAWHLQDPYPLVVSLVMHEKKGNWHIIFIAQISMAKLR